MRGRHSSHRVVGGRGERKTGWQKKAGRWLERLAEDLEFPHSSTTGNWCPPQGNMCGSLP